MNVIVSFCREQCVGMEGNMVSSISKFLAYDDT